MEHLRSQLAHQKSVLGEKLALERQLSTLEVELANEKRAVQRATQRQANQEAETERELREQLHDLERKLEEKSRALDKSKATVETQERTERELRERVYMLETDLAALRSSRDQGREEELRLQVKELQEKLADHAGVVDELERVKRNNLELQANGLELQRSLDELAARLAKKEAEATRLKQREKAPAKKPSAKAQSQATRKRRAIEMADDDEPAFQTPTQDLKLKRPVKKRGLDHTVVGEKSNFSITPFLNKTINFADTSIEFTAGDGPKS